MFDHLSRADKRDILLASRIRFGIETKIPRERAIDRMIENALYLANKDEWLSSAEILEIFKEIGGLPTLRLLEINNGLSRLLKDNRVASKIDNNRPWYRLSEGAQKELAADFNEASRRLERVLSSLFKDVLDVQSDKTRGFFLEFVCEVFRKFGSQWVSYIADNNVKSLLELSDIEQTAELKLDKYRLDPRLREPVRRRCVEFFQEGDPDYDYLKFALGQSFYIAQLLGMEGRDLLSEEIFSNGTLFLDSSVVIPALLPASRHYRVFKELCNVCKRLKITLLVTRPTIDEVRWVAAGQERNAATLYDKVPEKLAPRVKGDFFRAYLTIKESNPQASPREIFEPFHNLSETLRNLFGIETVDDDLFARVERTTEFDHVAKVLQECSIAVRKTEKGTGTLSHDAKAYMYLESRCASPNDKVWFLTSDTSLPLAWTELQPQGMKTRCFTLDGLLQSISPFVVADGDIKDFTEVFSQVIATQLLPQGRIFDIDDFLLFEDLALDCRELPEGAVEDALLAVKQQVLRGASYRRENLEAAAYELRRFFAQSKERIGALAKEREDLARKLEQSIEALAMQARTLTEGHGAEKEQMRAQHAAELKANQVEIERLRNMEKSRSDKQAWRRMLVKQVVTIGLPLASVLGLALLANRWGQGGDWIQRLKSFWFFYPLGVILALSVAKVTLFRNQELREVFKWWLDVKAILK